MGAQSQTDTNYKYKIEILAYNDSLIHNRCLIKSFSDSSVTISRYFPKFNRYENRWESTYNFKNMTSFKIRKNNSTLTWMLSGALAGIFVGIAIAPEANRYNQKSCSIFSDDCNYFIGENPEKAARGIIGGLVGGTIGAIIGSFKITIPIDEKHYSKRTKRLQTYCYCRK